MSLLAKIGKVALEVTQAIIGFAPIAQMAYPNASGTITTVVNDSKQIAQIIQQVEVIGQTLSLAGPQKLQAAAPLIGQVILNSDVMVGHKIQNADLFKQGCTKIADGYADISNSLNESGVVTVDKA